MPLSVAELSKLLALLIAVEMVPGPTAICGAVPMPCKKATADKPAEVDAVMAPSRRPAYCGLNVTTTEQVPPVHSAGAIEKSVPVYKEKLVPDGTLANVTVCCAEPPTATDPKSVGVGH